MARQYRRYLDEQVGVAIEKSFSWRETAYSLGLNGDAGSNNRTLKKIAKKYNFDFSHFKGQGWNLGKDSPNAIPLDQLLIKGSGARSDPLKKKLIKKGMLKEQCSECGQLPIWNEKPLTLELDHIDGDNTNNEFSNLRILCLHCHSQTLTFRGRKLKGEKMKWNKEVKQQSKTKICNSCDNKIGNRTKTGLCPSCISFKNRKVNRPSEEQLLKEIKETNYCAVGRKYGVSDNAIRKWLK